MSANITVVCYTEKQKSAGDVPMTGSDVILRAKPEESYIRLEDSSLRSE